jgi:hypothetical protein
LELIVKRPWNASNQSILDAKIGLIRLRPQSVESEFG